jgi:DNA-binding NarL/FixJ family response regulator
VISLARKPREGGGARLVIATRPALVREVLSRLINQEPDLEVVGEGPDEERIVEAIKRNGSRPSSLRL